MVTHICAMPPTPNPNFSDILLMTFKIIQGTSKKNPKIPLKSSPKKLMANEILLQPKLFYLSHKLIYAVRISPGSFVSLLNGRKNA